MDRLILEAIGVAVAELGFICFMVYLIYIESYKEK